MILYDYIANPDDFYRDIHLWGGRYLTVRDSEVSYMGSLPSGDPNCVGVMQWFDASMVLEVRTLAVNHNDLLYG